MSGRKFWRNNKLVQTQAKYICSSQLPAACTWSSILKALIEVAARPSFTWTPEPEKNTASLFSTDPDLKPGLRVPLFGHRRVSFVFIALPARLLASTEVPSADSSFVCSCFVLAVQVSCTDKRENKIFLIYKEIQTSSYMGKYLPSSSNIRKPFFIYDFATAPLWFSLYMRKIKFSFLSVWWLLDCCCKCGSSKASIFIKSILQRHMYLIGAFS